MPAHPAAFAGLARRIMESRDNPAYVDWFLDKWLDYRDRATEWDADRWGLDPDNFMVAERVEMTRRLKDEEARRLHSGG